MVGSKARSGLTRGALVVLVGPDGVGKTSVAETLADQYPGPTGYVHFRPPIWGRLPARPGGSNAPPPPKATSSGLRAMGWLRLIRSVGAFSLGFWLTIRRATEKGTLVIGDRWMYGYLVQPTALKFYGPPRLARLALRLVPRPDLVANLAAPAEVVYGRKQELTLSEIRRELQAWASLPITRMKTFSTEEPPERVARRILGELGT